jgi:hypothetical protein
MPTIKNIVRVPSGPQALWAGGKVQGSKVYPPLAPPEATRVQSYNYLRNLYYNPEIQEFANPILLKGLYSN